MNTPSCPTASAFELMVESAHNAMIITDTEGIITFANARTELFFHGDKEELRGRLIDTLLAPSCLSSFASFRDPQGVSSVPVIGQFSALRSDGTSFPVEVHLTTLYSDGSDHLFFTIVDQTERKLLEQQQELFVSTIKSLRTRITELDAELMDTHMELDAFCYTVSHDLQSPLRILSGFSQILLTDYSHNIDEEGLDFIRIIDTSARRMSDLIYDLLAFSKVGKGPLTRHETNLTGLAQEIIHEMKYRNEDLKADILLHDLAPAICDPRLMRQVLVNLISNAVKYSSQKEHPVIEIGMSDISSPDPVYYIRDNGAGFDMALVGKLFHVFQRMHSAEEFEGSGIGLATVHRIVTRHGGRIWAEGVRGEGATFYFTLPAM